MTVCNAILTGCKGIMAQIANSSQNPGSDSLKKTVDALQKLLLPHWSEDTHKKAAEVRKRLMDEASKGPLKVKAVVRDKKKSRRR